VLTPSGAAWRKDNTLSLRQRPQAAHHQPLQSMLRPPLLISI